MHASAPPYMHGWFHRLQAAARASLAHESHGDIRYIIVAERISIYQVDEDDMEVFLLLHSVVMHVTAALVILVYIPLSAPVKLLVRAFVKPLRKEDLRGKVVLITGASSGIGEVSLAAVCK